MQSISVNGATASDDDACQTTVTPGGEQVRASASVATLKDLSSDSNTVACKYLATAGTATFQRRWLVAVKVANL